MASGHGVSRAWLASVAGIAGVGVALGACGPALATTPSSPAVGHAAQRPAPGRHDAELCVTIAAAAPSCGPAQLELRRDGSARVRVDDLVYTLKPRPDGAEVVLMHGSVEVDDFGVRYAWVGRTLQFIDDERRMHYDVRVLK